MGKNIRSGAEGGRSSAGDFISLGSTTPPQTEADGAVRSEPWRGRRSARVAGALIFSEGKTTGFCAPRRWPVVLFGRGRWVHHITNGPSVPRRGGATWPKTAAVGWPRW